MEVLVPLGAVAASLVGMGVLGLFGRDSGDDSDLADIARRLDAREDPDAVERKLDALDGAIDTLVADADLDRHLRDAPAADASSVEKAEALSRAVQRDQLSVGPSPAPGSGGDSEGTVASAAASAQNETSPSSPAARRLLDATAAPERADRDELTDLLERAVGALDTQRALERALDDLPDDGVAPSDARRLRNRLDHPDNAVTAGVRRLAARAEQSHSIAESHENEREQIGDAADTLTAAATEATDLDIGPSSGRPVAERLRVLANAVGRDELGFGASGSGRIPAIASEIRRSRNPESAIAKRLLDRLASPEMGDVEAALDTAVEQLDAATTTRSIVSDLDRESVRDLVGGVETRLDAADGPVADALGERVSDLRGMLERADESNRVIPYAIRNELRFYDRALLSELGGTDGKGGAGAGGQSGAGTGTGESADVPLSQVTERREDLEDRYVDGRRDHNHSIPLHFLSLADALRDEAERAAATGDDARAAGLCAAADETLDHVTQLYERNEYSVMLRRLRG